MSANGRKSRDTAPLKEQCHEIFNTFKKKNPPGPQRFREIVRFQEDVWEKRVSACVVNDYVSIVKYYSDIVSA